MQEAGTGRDNWKAVDKNGVVAAGAMEAVAAGVKILNQGGNAADAAAATIFALNVTDHGQCSIGGEVPVLIFNAAKQEVKALCGQGRAPLSQEAVDWYMKNGIPQGDVKMAPVPSVVDLCTTMVSRYGTKTFEDVASPALALPVRRSRSSQAGAAPSSTPAWLCRSTFSSTLTSWKTASPARASHRALDRCAGWQERQVRRAT